MKTEHIIGPNVKSVYMHSGIQFTPQQYLLSKRVQNKLENAEYSRNGSSFDRKIKSMGWDTLIVPCEDNNIDIYAVSGLRIKKKNEPVMYEKDIFIGSYNDADEFEPYDMISKLNKGSNVLFKLIAPLTAAALIMGIALIRNCRRADINNNNKIEDTIKKNTKIVNSKIAQFNMVNK